ncbi:probable C-mannosyltransferase DPY19L2 isoform X5 [Monodelphis domestica]|uniref:probable C-mannosyltransferase DPY19L2 isoform X5 n=1 Tax=Monodelphis domestica TaxID=13616 RepID=UPI0024E1C1B3|nr:probable C-mannosyltransferase DPY19L2 isoform X5 [Monodelphis domestica]
MVVQTRNKHKEVPSKGSQSPRSTLRGHRGATSCERRLQAEEKREKGSPIHLRGGHKVFRWLLCRLMVTSVRRLVFMFLQKLTSLQQNRNFSWNITVALGALAGVLHWTHLTTLFENDRHFSHLSTLEREMTFRTEMGLYYSYFKTMVEEPSFTKGLWMIMNDKLTEFPLVINAVKRFHLYPEIFIASLYRLFNGTTGFLGIQTKTCYNVSRGHGINPIESCEGLGDPACFYITVIFVLNGLMMTLFFIYGTYLSGSQIGGLLSVICFFFNHGEMVSLFSMYVVGYIEPYKFLKIIFVNLVSIGVCFILMFGNRTFLSSYFAASLLVTWGILKNRNKILHLQSSQALFWLIQWFFWWSGTIILKVILSHLFRVTDQFHLSDLITARILRYTDFDTLMYTCAPEFDLMEKETPLRYMKTFLLPAVVMISYFIFKKVLPDILSLLSTEKPYYRKQLHQDESKNPPTVLLVFHELELFAFAILAIFIMRLKLFLTPHMCLMSSLISSKRLFGRLFDKVRYENFVFAILAVMSIQGWLNLQSQLSIIGEFSNMPQEGLLQWIKHNTRPDAVFAGTMPTMASVKLSTMRPIVNHPHYEDGELRARTKIVYAVYSRKTAQEVRDKLVQLRVNYYILEEAWCVVRTKPGCSMLEIWDEEDPENVKRPSLCRVLIKDGRPYFTSMYQNSIYKVLRVN